MEMGKLTNPHVSETGQLCVLFRFRDSNFEIPIITARIPKNEHVLKHPAYSMKVQKYKHRRGTYIFFLAKL